MPADIDRLNAVSSLVSGIQRTFADAKKIHVEIDFEWIETDTFSDGADLCPRVRIDIER